MVKNRLRLLMQETEKTQQDVANDLGITRQRFNFYVTGKREPDNEMLTILASYFGVSTDYLLGKEDKKKPSIPKDEGLSEDTLRVVEKFSRLTPENQQKVEEYMALLALKEDRQ